MANIVLSLILSVVSIVLSATLLYFMLRKNSLKRLKKKNDKGERWATQTKPIFGGVIFFAAFLLSIFISFIFTKVPIFEVSIIVLCVALAFFMGFWDDTKNSHPMGKFLVQLLIALILILSDIYIKVSPNPIINYSLTIFWVVSLMNSLNMLDNMDAITASVSATIVFSLIFYDVVVLDSINYFTFLLIGVFGALLAFLFWNWNPSKLYMGDNGSQFIGAFLAIAGILYFWKPSTLSVDPANIKEVFIIILAFIVPISDTATVTINRLLVGKSPFVGDRNHTTHNLFYLGLSEKAVALLLISISVLGNILAIYLIQTDKIFGLSSIVLFSIVTLVIFLSLYLTTKIKKNQRAYA
ncbi:MAG: undecaprenyl/decaprenyl-phosphate alpha-N-acetylglucosaminyl 1-phosphate transferase [Bacteroidales bacterium]|nr:undecaprenyl/decaprenyl-phosphate alpha-N-acetylglucosaminyl 1-phosphate transferase [Bacteroidales bacterium]